MQSGKARIHADPDRFRIHFARCCWAGCLGGSAISTRAHGILAAVATPRSYQAWDGVALRTAELDDGLDLVRGFFRDQMEIEVLSEDKPVGDEPFGQTWP
jgi:hypothetical protein